MIDEFCVRLILAILVSVHLAKRGQDSSDKSTGNSKENQESQKKIR